MPETQPRTDDEAALDLAQHLDAGEQLIWAGRPDAALYCRIDARLVVTGVFWCLVAGAAFWGFAGTFLSDEYDGLPLALRGALLLVAAAPFLAVAAYTLGGHVLMRRRRCRRIAYGVTDRRVLALRPRPTGRSRRLDALSRARVRAERASPDLEFHDTRETEDPVRFECVPDLDAVRRLVEDRVAAARTA